MIKLFYGPKKEFDNILPKGIKPKTLSQLVTASDAEKRKFSIEETEKKKVKKRKISISNLIARTGDYSMITESAVSGFISILEEYNIKNVFLQNPPAMIRNQIKKYYKDVKIERSTYEMLDIDMLKRISDEFNDVIIGQAQVKIRILGNLYFTAKQYRTKPVVLMFYGPAGVGKTETAKFLATQFGGKLFRKQFSMYQNNEFSDYIFGAKHNQPSLSKDLLERETNVILFDEFDKPNPLFFSAFYQLFDEGCFVDKNYKVHLENSIIICTSNFKSENDIRKAVGEPIFSRFDDFIEFKALSDEASKEIIKKNYQLIIETLDDEDKKIIIEFKLLNKILKSSNKFKNVREIDKFINQAISSTIIREKNLD